jgi:hypothetical protein
MRTTGSRLGWLALCLIPLSVGLDRFWHIYIAPGDGIPYPYRTLALTLTDALVVLTCVGWLAWRWRSGQQYRLSRGTGVVLFALALLALAAGASTISAYDRRLALGITAELAVLVVFFLAASELMAFFPRRWLLIGVAVAVVGQSLLAGWQAVAQTTAPAGRLFNGWASELTSHDQGASVVILPIAGRWLRSYGSFPHPNILGGFLALCLAVLAIHMDPRTRRLRLVALAMGFATLLLAFSRAALLAVLLGAVTILLVAPGAWRTIFKARTRLAVAVVASALTLVALVRVASLGSLVEQNSIETRAFYNSVASQVIGRGVPVGAGNLVVAQQHLLSVASAGSEPAHNVFVIALAELGLIGLVAWLSIIGSLLFAAWLRRGESHDRAGPLVAVTVLTPLLLLDHYLWTQSAGRVLVVWMLTVLMSSGGARGDVREQIRPGWRTRHDQLTALAGDQARGVTALRMRSEEANAG